MSKIALITGATSGIGAATSHLLAANGFDLILTGRRNKRLVELELELSTKYKAKCLLLCFDVRKLEQVQTALDSLPDNWKAIDVLINNAGLAVGLDTVDNGEIDNETWIDWAGGIWTGIHESDTLQYHSARAGNDEKHICPLQLGTIERCIKLYSNCEWRGNR